MLLSALALASVVVIEAHGAADVAKIGNVGWWSKRVGAQPTTGPSSFEVASGVDGDESVAALRILIYGSVTKATLMISEAPNQTTAIAVPKLQVCPTDSPWVLTTSPGPYADAPRPRCDSGAVALTRDATGNWSADVTSMLAGARSEVSVMVVPSPDKTLPVPPTFFVTFATSRVVADGIADVQEDVAPPAPSAPTAPGGVVAPRPVTAPAPAAAATTATTTPPTTVASAAPAPTRLGGVRTVAHKQKQWGKLVWVVPVSVLAALAYARSRRLLVERGVLATTP